MASSDRIEELKKKFDENPRRYFAPLANEFRKMGDFDQAILICQEFLPQQPGHMSGHIVYGQALFEAGRLDEARGVFETALTLDPENLIALRHLGDISRAGGDIDSARQWYRRVLDADPRNEEIAGVLASLDEPASIPWSTPTPRSVTTVPPPLGEFSVTPAAEAAGSAGSRAQEPVIEKPLESVPPQSAPADFASILDEARRQVTASESAQTSEEPELLDLDEALGIGQSTPETTAVPDELGVERAAETPFGFEPSAFEPAATDRSAASPIDGLEVTGVEAESVTAPLEGLEVTGAEAESMATPVEGLEPTGPDSLPQLEEPLFESLELPGEPTTRSGAVQSEERAAPVGGSVPPTSPPAAPAPAPSVTPRAPAASPPSGASATGFVTETMAELYVKQGHIPAAVDVYRQLAARYPHDEVYAARLAELEALAATAQEAPPATEQRVPEHEEAARPFDETDEEPTAAIRDELEAEPLSFAEHEIDSAVDVTAHPTETIRAFLSALANRGSQGANGYEPPDGGSSGTARVEQFEATTLDEEIVSDDEESASSSVDLPFLDVDDNTTPAASSPRQVTPPEGTLAERRGTLESTSGTVAGSIEALFAGAESNRADEEAATMLAGAFAGDVRDDVPMTGKPARRAQDELSLDHVFRERGAANDRGQPAFSFDQFFSQDATDGGTSGSEPASARPSDRDDDIQQFNAWLEGLKKT
jgi:tetratricopeptide (TPR) repeat protein